MRRVVVAATVAVTLLLTGASMMQVVDFTGTIADETSRPTGC